MSAKLLTPDSRIVVDNDNDDVDEVATVFVDEERGIGLSA